VHTGFDTQFASGASSTPNQATVYAPDPGCGRVPKYNHGFDVDHCHTTKTIRGYLCHGCNVALGMVADNPNTLINLAMRMGKHKTQHGLPF
jgi:hypothetical protein